MHLKRKRGRSERDPEGFTEDFCRTTKKLKKPVNIKKILEEEYGIS